MTSGSVGGPGAGPGAGPVGGPGAEPVGGPGAERSAGPHAEPAWGGSVAPVARAVAAHPSLWPVAAVTVLRLARRGWWRRWPPVPLPDPDYWRFRLETAYGGRGDQAPGPDDVVAYLRWCRGARPGRG